MASDSQIDDAIMGVLADRNGRWVKVAWVVVSAPDRLGSGFPSDQSGHELIAKRIEYLVEEGFLIAKGDITNWRFSEVRPT
jgi:hypothetical protein